MTDERDPAAGSEPETVIPPAPAAYPQADAGQPPAVPLAPPLGAPAPSPYPSPYPAQQQHPAQAHPQQQYPQHPQPGYPAPQYGQPGDPAAYPISGIAPAPARSGSRHLGIILGVVGLLVVIVIAGVAVAITLFLGSSSGDSRPVAVPTQASEQPSTGPSEGDSTGSDSETDETDGTDGTGPTDAGAGIADRLEAKIDEYRRLRDSGALWQSIPDSDYSRTAVTAFLYFLTDMKVATVWGVDEATAAEYDERMAMLEEKLLAQQPLGDDITITLEDGKVFRYDGETGEGGYSQE